MSNQITLLIVEDEPLIMMDLQFSAEDRDCRVLSACNCEQALQHLADNSAIHAAVLDVSLGKTETCLPIARELDRQGIPFILHSGDLNRHEERIRTLDAPLLAKPMPSGEVIEAAIERGDEAKGQPLRQAAG
ncbi:response regulator [Erythrobacter sp. MTPC3]|uniref:response regulator n=1 Tax=Erythrobacter sp. MTPC3 TaxID=3056564 RepID=UPI0036F1D970